MEDDMDKYIELLLEATRNVSKEYFKVHPDARKSIEKHYERIFCYELYHQMRCIQEKNSDLQEFTIHGELVKTAYEDNYGGGMPDFIVHVPGKQKNHIVVEVKTASGFTAEPILEDFKKLSLYVSRNHYKFGVFLWVNHDVEEFKEKLLKGHEKFFMSLKAPHSNIFIICVQCGKEPTVNSLEDLLNDTLDC